MSVIITEMPLSSDPELEAEFDRPGERFEYGQRFNIRFANQAIATVSVDEDGGMTVEVYPGARVVKIR